MPIPVGSRSGHPTIASSPDTAHRFIPHVRNDLYGPVMSERRRRQVDHVWLDRADVGVTDAEPGDGIGAQIRDEDVGGRDDLSECLVAVVRSISSTMLRLSAEDRFSNGRCPAPSPGLYPAGSQDERLTRANRRLRSDSITDDVRTEVAQIPSRQRRSHGDADLDHPDSGQRERAGFGRHDVMFRASTAASRRDGRTGGAVRQSGVPSSGKPRGVLSA